MTRRTRRRWTTIACLAALAAGLGLVVQLGETAPAAAEPATTVGYSSPASATRLTGLAFDTCTAPALATMRAWTVSPYDGVGVYIGGVNRGCRQPNLTTSWVSSVSALGWRLVPIYVGSQSSCLRSTRSKKFTAANARARGTSEAADAVRKAAALGMLPGSALYADIEHYNPAVKSCRTAVRRYVSGWTAELHRQGYLAGVYAHIASGAKHLAATYDSISYARVDALWIARWDRDPALFGWSGVADEQWANHQRGKQYRGPHYATYGSKRQHIDADSFDAPVATVARYFPVVSAGALNARRAPTATAARVGIWATGSSLPVVCRTTGAKVGGSTLWAKLADGSYVADVYLGTNAASGAKETLPTCSYPFQVTATALNLRVGPGASFARVGTLSSGALAWVTCQTRGQTVRSSRVWDRLDDGSYVSDAYVATPNEGYSPPLPRC